MDLRPILPSMARKDEDKSYKTGLLSLTKHDLILVMRFLERVKLLHPSPHPQPPSLVMLELLFVSFSFFLFSGTSIF
jgi:hypothetical protein